MKTTAIIFTLLLYFSLSSCSSIALVGPSVPEIIIKGPGSKTALNGPDGSHISAVAEGGTVVAPAIQGGVVAAAAAVPPVVAVAAAPAAVGIVGAPVVGLAEASGLEGQYIHDNTETLYDDGSYRGEH